MGELGPAALSERWLRLSRARRVALSLVLTIAGSVLVVLALKEWVLSPYLIPSPSMEPTLHCARDRARNDGCLAGESDRVLVNRFIYGFEQPQRGQIVAFLPPLQAAIQCGEGGTFVKRLIGLPGEELHEDKRGFIWVRRTNRSNWVKLKEAYVNRRSRLADTAHFGRTWYVPRGEYFMIGDNRAGSCDSRRWGAVPRNDLIGPVVGIYWPPSRVWIATPGLTGSLILAAFTLSAGSLLSLGAVSRSRSRPRRRRRSDL